MEQLSNCCNLPITTTIGIDGKSICSGCGLLLATHTTHMPATPTTKDGLLDEILVSLATMPRFIDADEYAKNLEKAKQAIEDLIEERCAERERLAELRGRFEELNHHCELVGFSGVYDSSGSYQSRDRVRELQTEIANLKAQSGSQEADEPAD